MLTIVGTVPLEEGIYQGTPQLQGSDLLIGQCRIPVERGTGALVAAALKVTNHYRCEPPYCLLAGDKGIGEGSRLVLEQLLVHLAHQKPSTLVLHYMNVLLRFGQPLKAALQAISPKPIVIGDAGGMYLAKASGIADIFDIFTPDRGELAFLADAQAAHPMYTKADFFQQTDAQLVKAAWENRNSPQVLVVKGKVDLICHQGVVEKAIDQPLTPALEAIGGTGDTLTGLVAALTHLKLERALELAVTLNRQAGALVKCTPRTSIAELIEALPLHNLPLIQGR